MMKKEISEKVDALTEKYKERLLKRVEEGKDLPGDGARKGRMPAGLKEENYAEYVALRGQLKEIRELRRQSTGRLREIVEAMSALCGQKKKAVKKKKVARKT